MQAVGQVTRFHVAPKESHIIAVKRTPRYLKGTIEYDLWYPKGNNLIIQVFIDAYWTGSIDDHKSTSGVAFYLGGCLVSWLSKKKTSISLSTTKLEYIIATTCCTEVLWMKKTFQDLQIKFDEPIPIFCDNTNAISISKNHVMHSKTKHIPIKYHFIREQLVENNIKLEYVGTKEKSLISSLNLCLVKHLNIFARSLGFSRVLIIFSLFRKQRGSGSVYRSVGWLYVRGSYPFLLMSNGEIRQ